MFEKRNIVHYYVYFQVVEEYNDMVDVIVDDLEIQCIHDQYDPIDYLPKIISNTYNNND